MWFYGNEYPFLSWMSEPQDSNNRMGQTVASLFLKQGFNVDPLLQKAGGLHLDHDLQ